MTEIILPIRELFTQPAQALRLVKKSPSLISMVLIHALLVGVGYIFSDRFFTFDSLKMLMPYLEKFHLQVSHRMLYVFVASLNYGHVLLWTGIAHGFARIM